MAAGNSALTASSEATRLGTLAKAAPQPVTPREPLRVIVQHAVGLRREGGPEAREQRPLWLSVPVSGLGQAWRVS